MSKWSIQLTAENAIARNLGVPNLRWFGEVGNAGGHRAMAKAVVPMRAFREKYGNLGGEAIGPKLQELVYQFLHEAPAAPEKSEKKREPVRL